MYASQLKEKLRNKDQTFGAWMIYDFWPDTWRYTRKPAWTTSSSKWNTAQQL